MNIHTPEIDRLPTLDMLAVINREDVTVAETVRLELPRIAQAVDGIAAALAKGGRLLYIGAGTSGRHAWPLHPHGRVEAVATPYGQTDCGRPARTTQPPRFAPAHLGRGARIICGFGSCAGQ